MGLFERLFKTDKNEKKDLSYIYKITELITNNNCIKRKYYEK